MKNNKTAYVSLISAVSLFGTIGAFRVFIGDFPSGWLSMIRGFVGALFLLLVIALRRDKISLSAVRANLWYLLFSGIAIGVNWILLFEAFKLTSIARATLCYYMQPVFVVLASSVVLHEKLTAKKGVCVLVALGGMVLISGVLNPSAEGGANPVLGMIFGVSAGVFYAADILLNKKMHDISIYDRTAMQLIIAGLTVVPYALTVERVTAADFPPRTVAVIAMLSILHTGIAYALYFGSMAKLPAQTIALFSYLDPAVAILITPIVARLLPGQPSLTAIDLVGALLILGSAVASEVKWKKKV